MGLTADRVQQRLREVLGFPFQQGDVLLHNCQCFCDGETTSHHRRDSGRVIAGNGRTTLMKPLARSAASSRDSGRPIPSRRPSAFQAEAMSLLGVTEEDLEPVTLQSFTKTTRSMEEALVLFRKSTEKRARLLQQVQAKRDELMSRGPPTSRKSSGDVPREQRMIAQSNSQAANIEQQNKRTLRRLAIHQLGTVYRQQKYEGISARVDHQARAHSQMAAESKKKEHEVASGWDFLSRCPDFEPQPSMDDHDCRIQLLRDERRRRLDESAQKVEHQIQKAHQNSEVIHRGRIEKVKRCVERTARRTASIEPMRVERDQHLRARAAERDHLAHERYQRVCEIEEQRVERRLAEIESRSRRSAFIIQKNSEAQRAKIAKDGEELERRIARSQEIIDELGQQRDENVRAFNERQVAAEQRIANLERQKRAKLFERSCNDAQRSENTRRLARIRQSQAERVTRAKAEKAAGTAVDLHAEAAQSLVRKERAQKSFSQKKDKVLMLHGMGHLSDAEVILKLKNILGVEEPEARAIVRAAKAIGDQRET
jgi:hypothetical protein